MSRRLQYSVPRRPSRYDREPLLPTWYVLNRRICESDEFEKEVSATLKLLMLYERTRCVNEQDQTNESNEPLNEHTISSIGSCLYVALYASLLGRLAFNKSAYEANWKHADNCREQYNMQNTNTRVMQKLMRD